MWGTCILLIPLGARNHLSKFLKYTENCCMSFLGMCSSFPRDHFQPVTLLMRTSSSSYSMIYCLSIYIIAELWAYTNGVCVRDQFNYGHENCWRKVRDSPILMYQGSESLESDTLCEKSWKNCGLLNRGWKCMYYKLSFHKKQHLTCTQKVHTICRWPNDHQHWGGGHKDLEWGHGTEQRW